MKKRGKKIIIRNYKRLLIIILIIILFLVLSLVFSFIINRIFIIQLSPEEGSGTPEDPFIIHDCLDLQAINNDLSAYYILENNIDCSDNVNWNTNECNYADENSCNADDCVWFDGSYCEGNNCEYETIKNWCEACGGNWAENKYCTDNYGFEPIGNSDTKFSGSIDGKGYAIENLFVYRPLNDNVGLFGFSKGEIKNLGLIDIELNGREFVGGIVGVNEGDILGSYVTGIVYANFYAGGLAGVNKKYLNECYSEAEVFSKGYYAGGLVSSNEGSIADSYSKGDVRGRISVGGLTSFNSGSILNSYATGNVVGINFVGGLIGNSEKGEIKNSYSTGNVETYYSPMAPSLGIKEGGFAAYNYKGVITNCYFNNHPGNPNLCLNDDSGTAECTSITNKNYFYNANNPPMNEWDFVEVWEEIENDFPKLRLLEPCIPNCEDKECGDDGCGRSCGTCSENEECNEGICKIKCEKNKDCDDGLYCNGEEICSEDLCENEVLEIDDDVDCTDDFCDEEKNKVIHTPDDGLCQDNEICHFKEGCVVVCPEYEEKELPDCISAECVDKKLIFSFDELACENSDPCIIGKCTKIGCKYETNKDEESCSDKEKDCIDTDNDGLFDYNQESCSIGIDKCIENLDDFSKEELDKLKPKARLLKISFNGDIKELSEFKIDNEGIAEVEFKEKLKLVDLNETGCFVPLHLDALVEIGDKKINVHSEDYSELNKQAQIKIYNINFKEPKIQKNGVDCLEPECKIIEYNKEEDYIIVDIQGFSEYEIIEGYVENGGGDGGNGGGGGGGGGGGSGGGGDGGIGESFEGKDNETRDFLPEKTTGIIETPEEEKIEIPEKRTNWIYILIGVIIFVIFIFIVLIMLRRKKRK